MDADGSSLVPQPQPPPQLDAKAAAEVQRLKLQLVKAEQMSLATTAAAAKKRATVLEEEEYTRRVDSIIERDFYPDVTKLRAELEYQDALERNDYERLAVLGKARLEANHRAAAAAASIAGSAGADTPATFETPMAHGETPARPPEFVCPVKLDPRDTEDGPSDKGASAGGAGDAAAASAINDSSLSLNSFLGRYTSEDNAAFEQLQEEARERHRERLRALSRDEGAHNARVEQALALPSAGAQMAAIAAASISDDKGPGGGSGSGGEADKLITWRYATKNAVMFDPEGAPLTSEETARLVRSQPVICHENTRFRARPFSVLPHRQTPLGTSGPAKKPNQAALLGGKIGVDGKEANTGGGATPAVNGFKYVASTPTLAPGTIPESPLMTWGEIESTPVQLRGDVTPLITSRPDLTPSSTQFRMPELPLREKAGQELANRILMTTKKMKRKTAAAAADKTTTEEGSSSKGGGGGGGLISSFGTAGASAAANRTSLERLHSMSPAAQLFATSTLGLAKLADRSLQASYSPMMSPSLRGSGRTPTPKQSLLRPLVTPSPSAAAAASSSNLTPGTTKQPQQRRTVNLSAATAAGSASAGRYQSSSSGGGGGKKRPNASDFF